MKIWLLLWIFSGVCAMVLPASAEEIEPLIPPPVAEDGGNFVSEPEEDVLFPPPPDFPQEKRFGEGPGGDRDPRTRGKKMPGPRGMHHWMMLKQAFDRLDDDTRNELLILMKKNPEAFREQMEVKVEEFRAERAKEIEKQVSLLVSYLEDKNEESKNAFRDMVRAEFMRQLEDNRRMVEEVESRVKRLTEEYQERAENADKIIEGQTQLLMSMSPEELREFLLNPPPPPKDRKEKFPGPGKRMPQN